jgi:hypothetical protein
MRYEVAEIAQNSCFEPLAELRATRDVSPDALGHHDVVVDDGGSKGGQICQIPLLHVFGDASWRSRRSSRWAKKVGTGLPSPCLAAVQDSLWWLIGAIPALILLADGIRRDRDAQSPIANAMTRGII